MNKAYSVTYVVMEVKWSRFFYCKTTKKVSVTWNWKDTERKHAKNELQQALVELKQYHKQQRGKGLAETQKTTPAIFEVNPIGNVKSSI